MRRIKHLGRERQAKKPGVPFKGAEPGQM